MRCCGVWVGGWETTYLCVFLLYGELKGRGNPSFLLVVGL